MSLPALKFAPWLGVFETLRVLKGVPLFLKEHRQELDRGMQALGLKSNFDFEKASRKLGSRSGRWRWIVTTDETRTLFTLEKIIPVQPLALSISRVRVGSYNWDARFKTISYLAHAQAAQIGLTPEVVLLNEHGHVASAARSNLFWRRGRQLFTPSCDSGCRRGVVRSFVLKSRKVAMGSYPSDHLLTADEIFLTNSMKGIVSINKFKGRSLRDFSAAEELRRDYEEDIAAQVQAG